MEGKYKVFNTDGFHRIPVNGHTSMGQKMTAVKVSSAFPHNYQ
jgi:hypothetical protein